MWHTCHRARPKSRRANPDGESCFAGRFSGKENRNHDVDTAGDYAFVALLGYGFAIVDLKDPEHPKTLSRTQVVSPDTVKYAADLKVDRSGNWVFVGMELSTTPGLLIYDATNKASPKLAGFWPAPGKLAGCHMIEYATIGDNEYVFCAPLDAAIYIGQLLPPAGGQRQVVTIARWVPASPKLAEFIARNPGTNALALGLSGHDDMTFQPDPITGKPTLFVSLWGLGVWFVDVSVPAAPVTLGAWTGETAKQFRGNIHTTMAFKSDDRRIVVSIPEVANPPVLFVIDATDYNSPKILAEWMAVPDFKGQAGRFSMHNFQIVEGKVYLAMYHGGLWVIDVSTADLQKAPKPIGSYMPHEPREDGSPYSVGAWDVVVWKGHMLTADSNGGFYVLHFAQDPKGDARYASFA